MFYTRLQVVCDPGFSEILMAEIAEAGFDSFLETEEGFEAYTELEKFDAEILDGIRAKYRHVIPLVFSKNRIEKQNWNEAWEKSLQPIVVDGKCLIRTDFHVITRKYPFEIIITPKMSFGTGHHQTTYLMIKNQMTVNHGNKRVMDAGCGTAILSIMASKLGAREVEAFDIDEWSLVNGTENIQNNSCTNIHVQLGKLGDLRFSGKFDIILANINKNVLLSEMKRYSSCLHEGGHLLLSGFYLQDVQDVDREASNHGLVHMMHDVLDDWAAVLYTRKDARTLP
jgi:ribosomal protein L11 methyltransferase